MTAIMCPSACDLIYYMSERKAINKYYPPDWDPSKVPKKAKNTNPNAQKVRLMLPFSMKCLLCSEYIASSRKFNARKETTSERYMGFKIIRFHIKCPRCNNNIVFRTDPKTSGFAPVEGGVRNYETQTEAKAKVVETEDEILLRLEKEGDENAKFQEQRQKRKLNPFWQAKPDGDAVANFEDKLEEQQKEQEMHDHLAFLQAKAKKLEASGGSEKVASVLQDAIAKEISQGQKRKLQPEDAALVQRAFQKSTQPTAGISGIITVKRKKTHILPVEKTTQQPKPEEPPQLAKTSSASLVAALAGYSSDSD